MLRRFVKALRFSLTQNREFIIAQGRTGSLILLSFLALQFTMHFIFICVTPLHYDERVSQYAYASIGFWDTYTNYPAPNNHVFYNLVARVFVLLPFSDDIGFRLPCALSMLLCSYYLFKLCRSRFSYFLSLALCIALTCVYHVILYSIQGRGYGFVNLFCVLMLYASAKLAENYVRRKYRVLLFTSLVLGLFTVPSFLYPAVAVMFSLFIYTLKQGLVKTGLFLADGMLAILLTFCCYAGILYNNDIANLTNPNSGDHAFSMSDPDAFERISNHFHVVFWYLFPYFEKLHFFSALVVISLIFQLSRTSRNAYLCFAAAAMFFAPYPILMVQQVIPFERNWLYLAIPTLLSLGFIITGITEGIGLKNIRGVSKTAICLTLLGLCAYRLSRFPAENRKVTSWDYQLEYIRKVILKDKMKKLKTVGWTGKGLEFYPADMLHLFGLLEKHKIDVRVVPPMDREDILVIGGAQLELMNDRIHDYHLVVEHNNIFIFVRNGF